MERFTIGKVAKAAEVGVETIRFYERQGLVNQPTAFDGAYRIYPREVVSRIRFIQRAKQLGFSLDEVRELLIVADRPNDQRATAIAIAEQNLAAIQVRLVDLERMQATLADFLASCARREIVAGCALIEALTDESD